MNGSADAAAGIKLAPLPPQLKLGSVAIVPATVLAPMAGVTDTVFRRFIRNLNGCGLIMTEFTSADGLLRAGRRKRKRYLHFYEDEHPISRATLRQRSRGHGRSGPHRRGLGFDMVDLNLGCPAKKVVKCNGGSGLLRDFRNREIFEAVRAAVKIPFTVKFRPAGMTRNRLRRTGEAGRRLRPRRPSPCTPAPANKATAARPAGSGSPPLRCRQNSGHRQR